MQISEKQIEDYICKYPETLLGYNAEVLGRQIQLPHGRLDILGWTGCDHTAVVELKARSLKEKDIGQLLRYTFDIRQILSHHGREHFPEASNYPLTIKQLQATKLVKEATCQPNTKKHRLSPWLVGSGIDDYVLAAASGAGIQVYIWTYIQERDTFSFDIHFGKPVEVSQQPGWLASLDRKIRDFVTYRSELYAGFIIDGFFRDAYKRYLESKSQQNRSD